MPSAPLRVERSLEEQLAVGEEIKVRVHQHVMVLGKPVLRALAPTAFFWWVLLAGRPGPVLTVLFWVSLALWLWVGWREIERRHYWFVATDKRILKYEGLITRNVPMMRLSKVTDMTYYRSVPGRVFGYGTIIIESAGQDQAMRILDYLPEPDTVYSELNAVLFGEAPRARRDGGRKWRRIGRRHHGPDGPGGPGDLDGGPGGSGGSGGGSGGDRGPHDLHPSGRPGGYGEDVVGAPDDSAYDSFLEVDDPTDVPPAGRPARARRAEDGTIYQSADRRARSAREIDTGPIPIRDRPRLQG